MKKVSKAGTSQPSSFQPRIRSRHPSHNAIRGKLGYFPKRCIIRFGSTTALSTVFPKLDNIVEINPVQAIKNSANKLLMKTCFTKAGVRTAPWYTYQDKVWKKVSGVNDKGALMYDSSPMEFPVVSKHIYGSRGTGNRFHKDQGSFNQWMKGKSEKDLHSYIVEEYFSGVREYRFHVSKNGAFYCIRKMLKRDTSSADRWQRHDDNSVWIIETNPNYDRPVNFPAIEQDCVKALQAVGLDVGAFDVRVQSARDKEKKIRENPNWALIEVNSAASFGKITVEKYKEIIPILIKDKINQKQ